MVHSVGLSVRPSVTPFSLCSYQRIIMEFPEVITNDRSDFHTKGQGQGLKVKVTEVKIQFNRFRTVPQVWIHIWWWNCVESFMLLSRDVLLIFKVIRHILSSPGWKIDDYDPNWAFPDCYSSLTSPMAWTDAWVGVGGFSKVVATFSYFCRSFNLSCPPPGMSE